jgi:hypothetical protein
MLVGDLLDYQPACLRFALKSADSHPAARKAKLDCIFQSKWFVRIDVIVRGYRNIHWHLSKCRPRHANDLVDVVLARGSACQVGCRLDNKKTMMDSKRVHP